MKKLKLAIVTPYPPSKITLNEYAYHLVKHFANKEDIEEIYLLVDDESKTAEIDHESNCPIHIIPCWKFNKLNNVVTIQKALKKTGADIVLYNVQFLSFGDKKLSAALGLFSPMVSKLFGTKSITLLHNIIETVNYDSAGITKNKWLSKLYNLIGFILTKILLQSNVLALTMPKYVEIIRNKYNAKNVAWLPHGSFELPPMPDFENEDYPCSIMTFGKFGTYKKVECMIEAVDIARIRTNKEIHITIAGSDSPNVKGYLDSVQNKYKHISNIEFTGYVAEEEVPALFKNCTAVMFPYTSTTGSSGVLHQAGSYGKAALLPNIGDLKALTEEEGYQGIFFKPEDVESMANAIQKIVEDRDLRIEIAKRNYEAAASLSMSDVTDWYLIHMQNLLENKRQNNRRLKKKRVLAGKAA